MIVYKKANLQLNCVLYGFPRLRRENQGELKITTIKSVFL